MLRCNEERTGLAQAKYIRRTGGLIAKIACVSVAAVLLVAGLGFGFANAGHSESDGSTIGLGSVSSRTAFVADSSDGSAEDSALPAESVVLANVAKRDISVGVKAIEDRKEAERIAAEKAAIERANQAKATYYAKGGAVSLPEVDWECGKEAFLAEWTPRIDAYLAGSNLAGYGSVFAEAAWENGVDPRWSPAISNTESGKGSHCFLPHNAWGWGQSSWSNWEDAINGHIAGLAKAYGYSITYGCAEVYCPPNTANWYANTLSQMEII